MIWFIVFWVVCGVLAYGLTLSYFQTEYPRLRDSGDFWLSTIIGIMGPCGLLGFLLFSITVWRFHGFQFLPKQPTEE